MAANSTTTTSSSKTTNPEGPLQRSPRTGKTAFFYGTLMAPEVFFTVCYGNANPPDAIAQLYTFRPAVLHGHCRRRVRYADYPGMVPDPAHEVRGVVVTGLTGLNLDRLDEFEGSEYERGTVRVKLLDKVGDDKGAGNAAAAEEEVEALTYIYSAGEGRLEDKEWDFEHFKKEKMKLWTVQD